jgi:hypothetical protein
MSVPVISHLYRRSAERKAACRDLLVELSSRSGGSWPTLSVQLLDESARGIRVSGPKLFIIGELVVVRIEGRPEASARVIWVGEVADGYELGLEFQGRSTIAKGSTDAPGEEEQASGSFPVVPR